MAVLRFPRLVDAISLPLADLADSNGDVEALRQVGTEFLREIRRPRREDVDALRHALLLHIGIHGLRAEEHRVLAIADEVQHRVVDCRKRQRFAHDELLE
jgi:hypothetical protein